MKKVVLFAFQGELLCFVHVLLNALDMKAKGFESGIVFEGASVKLVGQLADPSNPFHGLYAKAKAAGLVLGVCKACAVKLESLAAAQAEGLSLLDDMNGHAGMAAYIQDGWEVITF